MDMNLQPPTLACFRFFLNLDLFWRNNKTIIKFDFRRIWRILPISEGVIHLDNILNLQNSSYPTQSHSIIIASYTGDDPYKSWVKHLDIAIANINAESLDQLLADLIAERSKFNFVQQ